MNNQNQNISGNISANLDEGDLPKDIHEIFTIAKSVSLSEGEKLKGAADFRNFIDNYRPDQAPQDSPKNGGYISIISPYMANVRDVFARTFTASNFRKMRLSYTLTAFVLFIVFFAGAATAAIDALPGDLLYPLKINLNERFESLIAVDPEVKAKIAVKHAVNRITEAEQLAVKGRINAKAINYFNVGFTMQSSNVLDNVTRLQTEGRTDAAIRISSYFESSLAERQKNIENLANGADGKGKEILSVARQNILATITSANKQRSEIEKRRVNLKTSTAVSANTEVNTLIGTTTNIPVQNRTVNSVTAATSTPPNSINATTSVKLNLNSTPQTGHGTGTVPSTSRPEISISVPSAR